MSHTPGPWHAEQPAAGFSAIRQTSTGRLIFHLAHPSPVHGDPEMPDEEKYANLALMARAPDLEAGNIYLDINRLCMAAGGDWILEVVKDEMTNLDVLYAVIALMRDDRRKLQVEIFDLRAALQEMLANGGCSSTEWMPLETIIRARKALERRSHA